MQELCKNLYGVICLQLQVDKVTGRVNGQFKTYAICGAIRRMVSVFLSSKMIMIPFILISNILGLCLALEMQCAFCTF